jgi:putative bacteriocin precursor
MKTLILNGSPRKNGDTVSLIREVTKRLTGEFRTVDAYYCDISPCVDCRYCREHSGCAIDDEMQQLYDYIRECDNIIIASPVYFSELTGKLLDLGSRLQTYYCAASFRKERPIKKQKKGAVILVGGGDGHMDKAYGTSCTLLRLMNCTEIHPLVSSHDTDRMPAAEDRDAVLGTESIVSFLENHAEQRTDR